MEELRVSIIPSETSHIPTNLLHSWFQVLWYLILSGFLLYFQVFQVRELNIWMSSQDGLTHPKIVETFFLENNWLVISIPRIGTPDNIRISNKFDDFSSPSSLHYPTESFTKIFNEIDDKASLHSANKTAKQWVTFSKIGVAPKNESVAESAI